jgi:hypothetical protein
MNPANVQDLSGQMEPLGVFTSSSLEDLFNHWLDAVPLPKPRFGNPSPANKEKETSPARRKNPPTGYSPYFRSYLLGGGSVLLETMNGLSSFLRL